MKNKLKIIIFVLLLLSINQYGIAPPSQTLEHSQDKVIAHYLNVGQGSSTLIEIGDYKLLVDAGPDEAGKYIVNYLQEQTIDKIDLLVVTHPHDDHIGAVDDIVNNFSIGTIIDSDLEHPGYHYDDYISALAKAKLKGTKYLPDEDMIINIDDDILIEIIENGDEWDNVNNNSVIVRVVYQDTAFLITGDLEKKGEKSLLAKGKDLKANVLLAGHHGSSTSNSNEFISAVNPDYVVVSAEYQNIYGHPHSEVRTSLADRNIILLETAYYGEIVFYSDGVKVTRDRSNTVFDYIKITKVDCKAEIVTIKNSGAIDIDMTGWYLISYSGDQRFNFPEGFVLKKGDTVDIISGKFAYDKGSSTLMWTTDYIWSNNTPDPAYLYSSDGTMVSMKY